MTDTVLTYKGRPIVDLTKNELVDAMTWAFQEIEYQRERADRLLNAAALAEPELEDPTDTKIVSILKAYAVVEPQMGVSRILHEKHFSNAARAALARWGNYPASPDSSTSPRSENA